MKKNEFENLRTGDKVLHKHYGPCDVVGYTPMFGPHLQPTTEDGKQKLKNDSGVDCPLLEDSSRLIQLSEKQKTENI